MNHKIAFASLALFTAFAGTAATLHAGTDVHISIGLGNVIARPLPPPVVVVDRNEHPRGYWKTVTIKEWVPGRWVIERDRRGHSFRSYEAGHYTFHDERVFVSNERGRGNNELAWDRDDRR